MQQLMQHSNFNYLILTSWIHSTMQQLMQHSNFNYIFLKSWIHSTMQQLMQHSNFNYIIFTSWIHSKEQQLMQHTNFNYIILTSCINSKILNFTFSSQVWWQKGMLSYFEQQYGGSLPLYKQIHRNKVQVWTELKLIQ